MWKGFIVIDKDGLAYGETLRKCAIQALIAGEERYLYKDFVDLRIKGFEIAYVQVERLDG